ncbi:MAG: DUF411 domain-containing protein [Methylicorpusculum sp.]|nr:DUF411 domain-containing protein [Methylicorpusculum sp.]MDO9241262.1 DUF411 domain-containing protein [Methylicorpusculum sp.]MDP2180610.1 DUF411 domain-containing protein [Methylicorpusculum sp.]MDP3530471.1 DUF411 domain-containing protein [Methylicorpusculum sp.]
MKMNKKLLALVMPLSIIFQSAIAETTKEILVYRSPTCSCCGKWLEHLKQNNFDVKDIVTEDMDEVKAKLGVPKQLASCHTAVIDGYVVEGHLPAADIEKMLKDKPKIAGISVPGMPMGTPGMEMGGRKDPYQVISFDKDNNQQIYNSYENE